MNVLRPVVVSLLAAALFTACKPATPGASTAAAAAPAPTNEQAAKAFDALLDQQWQYQLQHSPEFASIIGDKRYNDRWSDYSLEAAQAERVATAALLRKFEAVDAKALDEQRQLSLQMMLGQLRDRLEGLDLKTYEMPLEPIGGIQLALAGYGDAFAFENAKDYQDYITRLKAIPTVIDQVIAVSRQGAKDGLVQPRYLLERLPEQIDKIAAMQGAQSPFASPLKKLDGAVPADQRAALRTQLIAAIDQQVRPAYTHLAAFVRDEYAAQGRAQEGIWSLPDGERRYRYAIHTQTTTDMAPEEIHQIGLKEVARIEGEMAVIAKAQGYPDLASFRKAVDADKRHFAKSGEQILQQYRQYIAAMQPELPKLFGKLPTVALEVQAMPAFRRTAPGAEYWQSNPEGSKPAIVKVNTSDYAIHTQTTTDMAPEEIHQIGLKEVARIEGEMAVIAKAQGYPDLASFRKAVDADKRHFAKSGEQILQQYRQYIAAMQPELPKLFGKLPTVALEVQAMPAFRRTAPGAEYWQSNPEGSKPAIVKVNTSDYASRTLINIETTAYHEGVPGHHLQISLAQTLPLPPFRQQAGYNAYIEGWALYAERLGKDIGFFKDPYNDYGRLSGELLRANRLVLDTGVHYKRWNRQQMVDFFHAHPSDDEPSIQSETDRYIVWPGQALGYKLGQLQILALRAEAEKELGTHFDIRGFHDAVLGGGAMPLAMLQQRVRAWIVQSKAAIATRDARG